MGRALAGREEKQLCLLLQFLNRYLTDTRFSKLCIYVSSILIDLYLPNHGFSNRVDNLFADMAKKLDREVSYIETMMELSGAVDIVLTSSHQNTMTKPITKLNIESVLCLLDLGHSNLAPEVTQPLLVVYSC